MLNIGRLLFAKFVTKTTNAVAFLARPFVSEEKLLDYKPIHLCWWFRKHGYEIPKYFIAGHTFFDPSSQAYRFYEDGTLTGSTALGTQSTALAQTISADRPLHLRVRIQENSGAGEANVYRLEYQKNGGGYNQVTTTSSNVRVYNGNPADGATVTTNRLGTGSGSFVSGRYDEGDGVTPSMTLTANNYTEHVWSIFLRFSDLVTSDTLQFRVVIDGKSMTHNVVPQVNVTILSPPTVTTAAASSITATSATGWGNITATGGANATVRGFVVSTTSNPTTGSNDFIFNTSGSYGTGAYSQSMTGLSPSTLYHYRAYATNSAGTSYGADTTFTTTGVDAIRNLVQYASDNETPVAVGERLTSPEQPTLMYDATVATDAESTEITPYVEVDPTGTAFTDTASTTGQPFAWNPDMWAGRRGAGIVYNPDMNAFIMTHGYDSTTYFEQVFRLMQEGGQWKWRELVTRDSSGSVVTSYDGTQAPEGRYFHMLTWGSTNGHAILFGGYDGTDLNDMWRLWFGSATDDEPEWWEVTPTGDSIAARANIQNSCCYDEDGAKSWLFGGWGASYYNDLYEIDTSSFNPVVTQLDSGAGTAPPVSRNSSLIFDELNNRLIQFGGYNGTTSNNQVWEYDLTAGAWTQLSPTGTAPGARELHTAAYDAVNQRMIIRNGNTVSTTGTYYRDVWELDLTDGSEAWNDLTQANADNMPLSVVSATSAVDTDNNLMLQVGGTDSTSDDWRRESVIDMNETGDPITPYGLPWNNKYRPLDAPAYAYNPDHDEFVMTHGLQHMTDNTDPGNGGHGTATHIYDVTNNLWRNGVVGLAPFQREGALMVYDTNRNRFIFFGGMQGNNGCLNDTWSLTRNSNGDYYWTKLNPTGTLPTKRWLMAGGYDAVNDRMVLWGGQDQGFTGNELSDTWELSFSSSADGAWTQRTPTGTGPTAASASAYAVDTTNNHLYIAGGATNGDGTYSNALHYLDMSTTSMAWTSRATFTTARRSSVLTYDNIDERLVLWAGWSGSILDDLQAFGIVDNSWNDMLDGTPPSARRSHAGFAKGNTHYFTAGRPGTGTWFNDTHSINLDYFASPSPNGSWTDLDPTMYQKIALPQSGLSDNTYHWQGWAGGSLKVSFGANAESATDFEIGPDNSPPSVTLDSPADASSDTDTTPTLSFTGTDSQSDDIRYNVQVDTVNTFDSTGGTIDSYASSNIDSFIGVFGGITNVGQSFTGDGSFATSATFYTWKNFGSPSGASYARIWSHTGTFGSTGEPDTLLATSDSIDVSTFNTGTYTAVTYTFSGADIIALTNGTKYFVELFTTATDVSNGFRIGVDGSSPSHAGNRVTSADSTNWNISSAQDIAFSVSGSTPLLSKTSGTDSGFANVDTPADTDPFNSGDQASFTVQGGDALAADTYYWRVRGIDPAGSNTYGAWSSTRSFTVAFPDHTTDALKRKQGTPNHSTDSQLNTQGNYTYNDEVTLPTNDNLLANPYDATDYSNVATNDAVYKSQTGSDNVIEQGWVYHTNNTDEITVEWNGKTSLAPTSSTVYLQLYEHEQTSTYYFDGSDAAASDPNGVWTDETNADDGSVGTVARTSTNGSSSSNYLQIEGTNATGTRPIIQVRARIHTGDIYSGYLTLTEPSGGWTLAKLQGLEVRVWKEQPVGPQVNYAIYEDGDAGGTALVTGVTSDTSPVGISLVNIEVTTGGWTTLDSDNTTAVDTEFTLTGTQTTSLSNYYDTGNRVAFRVYQGNA